MTSLEPRATHIGELARLVPRGGVVLVQTDDGRDPRYQAPRALATELARAAEARLLFFHETASALEAHPYAWDAVTPSLPGVRAQRPLEASELDELGCGALRKQLVTAEAQAIGATAWLARRPGPTGIAEAVERCGVAVVVLSADETGARTSPTVLQLTAAYHASRIDAPVVAVDESGTARLVARLPSCPPGSVPAPAARHGDLRRAS